VSTLNDSEKGQESFMPFNKILLLYAFTVPVFFAVDMAWLGWAAKRLYKDRIGHLMSPNVNWIAALVFYFCFIAGILLFAVLPAVEKGSFGKAVVFGVLFGFFTYGTYDLTNLATLKDWPLIITVIDILWGMVLTGTVSAVSYWIAEKLI
jgi:uncharacterized membrane protein